MSLHVAEEVGEDLLFVDVETLVLEPRADVDDVAVDEVEAGEVRGDVDRLREIYEPTSSSQYRRLYADMSP
ncbi:MAG: hypothetical protein ACJAR2_000870 [Ilumatobacter sp.]